MKMIDDGSKRKLLTHILLNEIIRVEDFPFIDIITISSTFYPIYEAKFKPICLFSFLFLFLWEFNYYNFHTLETSIFENNISLILL